MTRRSVRGGEKRHRSRGQRGGAGLALHRHWCVQVPVADITRGWRHRVPALERRERCRRLHLAGRSVHGRRHLVVARFLSRLHVLQQAPVDTLAGQKLRHDSHVVHHALRVNLVRSSLVLGQILLPHVPRAGPPAHDRGKHLLLQFFTRRGPRRGPRGVRSVVLLIAAAHTERHAREAAPLRP